MAYCYNWKCFFDITLVTSFMYRYITSLDGVKRLQTVRLQLVDHSTMEQQQEGEGLQQQDTPSAHDTTI